MPLEKVILAEGDDNLRRTVAEFIRSKRIDVAEAGTIQDVYDYLGKDEFDLVFIDAQHSYEGVRLDLRLWEPLVRPGRAHGLSKSLI